jgi:hypothetical protein
MTFTVQQIVLALATAVGAYGGFPEPPPMFKDLVKNEMFQWALVWVLIYQGGSGQDITLATLVTAAMFAAHKSLI